MAKNAVIAGDYKGKGISVKGRDAAIILGFTSYVALNKYSVQSYELITEEHRKSAASGVARGLVGGALLGPVGMLAGGLSAKSKGTYQLVIQFKDGKRSLIEVDEAFYKGIVKSCF